MTNFYYGTGKRKTSVARCFLVPGIGRIVINKRPAEQYFRRLADTMVLSQPLAITENINKFDILITVKGGGSSGQACAIRHGIARALLVFNPELRHTLKHAHFLTRDPRKKERKKYGQRGARARYQYSKR